MTQALPWPGGRPARALGFDKMQGQGTHTKKKACSPHDDEIGREEQQTQQTHTNRQDALARWPPS
jgi:hypothetical protein